jgi:hypothetical protein
MAKGMRPASSRKPNPGRQPKPRFVFQFLIELNRAKPRIWRRLQVPDNYSFWDLHVAIQDAMGWLDCHLHEFRIRQSKSGPEMLIGIPDDEYPKERPCLAGWQVRVSDYFGPGALPVIYAYDFGDGWEHTLQCEGWFASDTSQTYPRCVDGAGACPPEDCGGPHGYQQFLDAIANPKHPEHGEMKAWIGRDFDSKVFDPAQIVFDDPRQRWESAFAD